MNTWGFRSINCETFNTKYHSDFTYPVELRDIVVTALRLSNLTLNVLGYIPGVSVFSGVARIALGSAICLMTLAIGERNASQGIIIQHWYDEALITGISQIARGVLEAFVPMGWTVNATLDLFGTFHNLSKEVQLASTCPGCMGYASHGPHPDPDYPLALFWLYFV